MSLCLHFPLWEQGKKQFNFLLIKFVFQAELSINESFTYRYKETFSFTVINCMKIQEICFMMSQALARQYICSKIV